MASDLHFQESGTGPALILLHGSGPGVSGASNFEKNLPVFTRHFRAVMLDMPGFGDSPAREYDKPYPEVAAAAVVELMDDLGIDKAHLIGNSMGGWVALEMALGFGDRVDRMVLMGPGGLHADVFSVPGSEGARAMRRFMMNPSKEGMRDWVDCMVSDISKVPDELIEERYQRAIQPGIAESVSAIFGSLGQPASHPPVWSIANTIAHPTLLTWGRDDRMLPVDGAFFGARRMPNADLCIFSNCGHWAQVERKDDFERAAIDFFTR